MRTFKAIIALLLFAICTQAQNNSVSIGTTTTKSKAILWLKNNGGQGLILPSVSTSERTAMGLNNSDEKGMIVFDNSLNQVFYWNGLDWLSVSGGSNTGGGASGIQINGNTIQLGGSGGANLSAIAPSGVPGQLLMWNGTSWVVTASSGAAPSINQVLMWNGTTWAPQSLSTGGTVTNVTGTAPLAVATGTTTPVISMAQANATTDGFLSKTDFTTFSGKVSLGGDLSGNANAPIVSKIQGVGIASTAPATNQVLQYNGTNWVPTTLTVGSGSVTSVGLSLPSIFTVTNSPVTTNGVLTGSLASQTANTVFAAPNGSGGAPTFRTLVLADLPTLSIAKGGTGLTTIPTNGQVLIGNGTGYALSTLSQGAGISITNGAGTISIAANTGVNANQLVQLDGTGRLPAVDGSQLTNLPGGSVADGSITGGSAGAGVKLAANTITDANVSSTAAIAGTKINPNFGSQAISTTGSTSTAGLTASGTVTLSSTTNSILSTNGSGVVAGLTASAGNQFLKRNAANTAYLFSTLAVTDIPSLPASQITSGIFSIAQGGTGLSTTPTNGQLLIGNGTGYALSTLTAGSGININNAAGTITLGLTPGVNAGQILKWNGTNWALANDDVGGGSVPTLNSGQILIGDGTSNAAATLTGDATLSGGTLTIANTSATGGNIISAINANAGSTINGVRVSPAFGTQNISTSGTLNAGATTASSLTVSGTNTTLNTVPYSWPAAQGGVGSVLTNNGSGTLTWAASSGLSSTLPIGQMFVGNASNVATAAPLTGDAALNFNLGNAILTIGAGAINSNKIADGAIADIDVSATAAIAGTKITPAFGTQNISTSGTLNVGAATATSLTVSGTGTTLNTVPYSWPASQGGVSTVLTNNGSGTLTWGAIPTGWSLTGNSSTNPATNFIGTTDPNDLIFKTNSTEQVRLTSSGYFQFPSTHQNRKIVLYETANNDHQVYSLGISMNTLRYQVDQTASSHVFFAGTSASSSNELMRITGLGNVGIGTTTPNEKLDVAGNIRINSNDIYFFNVNGDFNHGIGWYGAGKLFNSQLINGPILYGWDGGALGSRQGSENIALRWTTAGNVGIGNIAPTEKLDITGNLKFSGALMPNNLPGTAGQVLTSQGPGVAPTWSNASSGWSLTGNSITDPNTQFLGTNAGDLAIRSGGSEKMRILPSGNVGIGTTTPTKKLEILGQTVNEGPAFQLANSDRSHLLELYPGNSGDPNPFILVKGGDPLRFATDASGFTETMRIAANGNLGVGTPAPASKLTVGAGNIQIDNERSLLANNPTDVFSFQSKSVPNYSLGWYIDSETPGLANAWLSAFAGVRIFTGGTQRMRISDNGISIGSTSPATTAALDIQSTTKGLLIPRLTTAQRDAITSPDLGLMVYNTSTSAFNYYNGGSWVNIGGGSGWGLTGNAGTNPATNFIGTTDAQPLRFATGAGGVERMRIDAIGNVGIGTISPVSSLHMDKSGSGNYLRFTEGGVLRGLIGISGGGTDLVAGDLDNQMAIRSESDLLFSTGSAERMRIANTGNVGIGTTSPVNRLDIEGGLAVGATYSGTSTAPSNGAIIQGNVGIGTTAQPSKLTVQGGNQYTQALISDNTFGTWNEISNTSTGGQVFGIISTGSSNAEGVGKLVFNASASLGAAGSNIMTLVHSNSNVGIGTTAPTQRLDVNGSVNIASTGVLNFGGVGVLNTSGNANSITANIRTLSNTATGANGDGLYIGLGNSGGTAGHLRFYTNGTQRMHMDASNGMIGINTTNPSYPLDIVGGGSTSILTTFFNTGNGGNLSVNENQNPTIAVRAFGGFLSQASGFSGGFYVTSDERIKRKIGVSNSKNDLSLLMKVKVTDYKMRDSLNAGNQVIKGLLAQEVEAVYPQAVTKQTNFIPNLYTHAERLEFDHSKQTLTVTMTKPHNLIIGDKVKLISGTSGEKPAVVSATTDNTFTVADWNENSEKIFVYGKEVNDFRIVDYDRLFTLNISATQELAKMVEDQKKIIEELKAKEEENKKKIASLEASLSKVAAGETELAVLKSEIEKIKAALGLTIDAKHAPSSQPTTTQDKK